MHSVILSDTNSPVLWVLFADGTRVPIGSSDNTYNGVTSVKGVPATAGGGELA